MGRVATPSISIRTKRPRERTVSTRIAARISIISLSCVKSWKGLARDRDQMIGSTYYKEPLASSWECGGVIVECGIDSWTCVGCGLCQSSQQLLDPTSLMVSSHLSNMKRGLTPIVGPYAYENISTARSMNRERTHAALSNLIPPSYLLGVP